MREEEFEKQVRKKMEQLGFDPSDSVWTGVDNAINKEKKRRVPLLWLFLFSGLLLAGGVYYFSTNKNLPGHLIKSPEQAEISKKQNKEPVSQSSESGENIPGTTNDKATNNNKETHNPTKPGVNIPGTTNDKATNNNKETHNPTKPGVNIPGTTNNKTVNNKGTIHKPMQFADPDLKNQKQAAISDGQKSDKKEANGLAKQKNASDLVTDKYNDRSSKTVDKKTGSPDERNVSPENAAAAAAAGAAMNNSGNQSSVVKNEKSGKNVVATAADTLNSTAKENKSKKDSIATAATTKHNEQKTKQSNWKIGYTVGAGVSNLNQDLLNSVMTISPSTNVTNSLSPNISRGTVSYSSSPIHAGFSFDAGAFAKHDLSKRLSFSAGLSYHYYSTKINTGEKIDPALYSPIGISSSGSGNSYYENGNNRPYTNQYHFLEIPLLLDFQVNKAKGMPFIWELGITPGYVFSSNALYYVLNANVYTNHSLQTNKMQLNGVTALMIGLPMYAGMLELGPELQYGLTGFIKSNNGNPGHLFYAGLKISFIPGKK
jgi:hypothetical protein